MIFIVWITLFTIGSVQIGLLLMDRLPAVMGSILGMALWLVVALGGLNLEHINGSNLVANGANELLVFLALAPLLVNVIYLFADATNQLPTGEVNPGSEI
jgi:hypothetical protein